MDSRHAYGRAADIIEITLKDCTGRKQDRWITNTQDTNEVARIMKSCIDKCGLDIRVETKDKVIDIWKADKEFTW